MFHFHLALCFPHHFTSYMLKPIFIALSFFQVELILNSEFVLEKKKLLLESSLLKKQKQNMIVSYTWELNCVLYPEVKFHHVEDT